MNLARARVDRDIKFYLEPTQDTLCENDFLDLVHGNSDHPEHPVLGVNYNVPNEEQVRPDPARLISARTVLGSALSVKQDDSEPHDFVDFFMSNHTQTHSPNTVSKIQPLSSFTSVRPHIVPKVLSSKVHPHGASIRNTSRLTQSSTVFYRNYKPETIKFRARRLKPSQNPSVPSSFMIRCLALNTPLGKFAALALFLGCMGLLVSTYGSTVFCASAALAVTGMITCGIGMFRKSRADEGGNNYMQGTNTFISKV